MPTLALSTPKTVALRGVFGSFVRVVRERGVTDQELAEWLLSVTVRWLAAHGVAAGNIHLWIDRELREGPKLQPLVAAARSTNDFGGRR